MGIYSLWKKKKLKVEFTLSNLSKKKIKKIFLEKFSEKSFFKKSQSKILNDWKIVKSSFHHLQIKMKKKYNDFKRKIILPSWIQNYCFYLF